MNEAEAKKVARNIMRRLGYKMAELEKAIEQEVQYAPSEVMYYLLELIDSQTSTNCWYAEKQVAPFVKTEIKRTQLTREQVA